MATDRSTGLLHPMPFVGAQCTLFSLVVLPGPLHAALGDASNEARRCALVITGLLLSRCACALHQVTQRSPSCDYFQERVSVASWDDKNERKTKVIIKKDQIEQELHAAVTIVAAPNGLLITVSKGGEVVATLNRAGAFTITSVGTLTSCISSSPNIPIGSDLSSLPRSNDMPGFIRLYSKGQVSAECAF